jgi:hypothetical protein
VGVVQGARLREAQFDNEAILKGAEEPFDASPALGRRGGDPFDAQLVQRAPDLGGGVPPR